MARKGRPTHIHTKKIKQNCYNINNILSTYIQNYYNKETQFNGNIS